MFTEFYVQKGGSQRETGNTEEPLPELPLPLTPPEKENQIIEKEKQIIDELINQKNKLNKQLKPKIIDNFNKLASLTIRKEETIGKNEIKRSDSYIRMKFLIKVLLDVDVDDFIVKSYDNQSQPIYSNISEDETLLILIQKILRKLKEDLPLEQVTNSLDELFPQTSSV